MNYVATFSALFELYEGEAIPLLANARCKAGERLAGEREFAQALVNIARSENSAPWFLANFNLWFLPFIFSPNSNARHDIVFGVVALFPAKVFNRLQSPSSPVIIIADRPSWIETLKEEQIARGREILQILLSFLPNAFEVIRTDFPSHNHGYEILGAESYRAVDFLELICLVIEALNHTEPIPKLEEFFRAILPHTQAYDPHLRSLIRISVKIGIPDDLLFSQFKPVPFDAEDGRHVQRGMAMFEFFLPLLKNVATIPSEVINVLLCSFVFVKVTASVVTTIKEILKLLVTKNRDAVLACLDANFDQFATRSLVWVASILEEANEQRPILQYFTTPIIEGVIPAGKFITLVLTFHVGPVENHVDKLIALMETSACSKDASLTAWRLIQGCERPPDQILSKTIINVHKLKSKAKLA